jgi:hypothetical protein
MSQKKIREEYKNLPHIKKVWVLNGEVHIHEVKNGVCLLLDEPEIDETIEQTKETTLENKVVKQRKKK